MQHPKEEVLTSRWTRRTRATTKRRKKRQKGQRKRVNLPPMKQKLTGHRNARTMIKEAAWWGKDFIFSGSDCGHLFAWDRNTGECVTMMEADRHVVNCVQ